VPVFTPRPESAQDLMEKYGITAEQAGDGSPDLRWLFSGDASLARPYSAGDRLTFGAEAFPGREPNDLVLWIEDYRAVVSGDTLVDFGQGLEIPLQWLREGVTREQVVEGLRPLLALPVEHVLAAHGGPTDRAALERALS
jgi:glyoxylase-like metal-dependent hydrolase (beta-lactamase superfamily II)